MDSKVVSLVLLVCSLILSYNGVEGGRKLSRKEDMELERQLKLLNKPAVMSIQLAFVGSDQDQNNTYYGVGGVLSVHNPSVVGFQLSSGHVRIQNGVDLIRAGWMVNPTLYGDNLTRLYTSWASGDAGCYNTRCPGFITVREDIPLDLVFQKTSVPGGERIELELFIYQDKISGNWWLTFGPNNTQIGYWPKHIFTNLAGSGGSFVAWGGEVVGLPQLRSPPMGAGFVRVDNPEFAAYCRQIIVVDESHNTVRADDTKSYIDYQGIMDYYHINDAGNNGEYWGHYITYGGPGGIKGD
ncbi:hypothetical protein HHK36_028895 [Tetracentron sinense]|uniref:Neprosin PEP catalytic domain-containing protein n=1 Tax=Tetracentron sinense TaxID=13715 RepID=A0A834YDX6_TETSI|nr:hypothetical protein HHK36_028895 [Tetracentron sinense]